jgi:hypothetical protein
MKNQIKLVVQCHKSKICNAVAAAVSGVRQIKTVVTDRVMLTSDDFGEVQLPAVQFIDLVEPSEHEKTRTIRRWNFALELIMKPTQWDQVTQHDLWNLSELIIRAVGQNPNFGIPGVIHVEYLQSETDLHVVESHYIAKLNFRALYYAPFVRSEC